MCGAVLQSVVPHVEVQVLQPVALSFKPPLTSQPDPQRLLAQREQMCVKALNHPLKAVKLVLLASRKPARTATAVHNKSKGQSTMLIKSLCQYRSHSLKRTWRCGRIHG